MFGTSAYRSIWKYLRFILSYFAPTKRINWKIPFHSEFSLPNDHFAIKHDTNFTIGYVRQEGLCAVILINPTDCRGYRLIVQLWDETSPQSTFNRQWSMEEFAIVMYAGSILMQFFASIGCYPQLYFAGNNALELANINTFSSSLSPEPNQYVAGKKEPAMLHIHVLGRGATGVKYVCGIPLQQPELGEEFNLKGHGEVERGTIKVAWLEEDLANYKCTLVDFIETHFSNDFQRYVE